MVGFVIKFSQSTEPEIITVCLRMSAKFVKVKKSFSQPWSDSETMG
jgi:hypothetical protein